MRELFYLHFPDPNKIQNILKKHKEFSSNQSRLIKIRDDKHTLLNIKYKVPKDYRGKVASGKQIFNNELYEKKYQDIDNNFELNNQKNNTEKKRFDKKNITSLYEFYLLDNINPRFVDELTKDIENTGSLISLKARTLLDYYKIDLANSSLYDYEITNEHIVTMIDKEKYSFKYAKYRARRFFDLSIFNFKFHKISKNYRDEYIESLKTIFNSKKY
jgi:hypothetical protein